jgi:hypothetical protein
MSIPQLPSVATVVAVGCWVDLFEGTEFKGKMRRLFGPSAYMRLRNSARNWGIPIRSVVAGPGAFVHFYVHGRADSGVWLEPGSRIADLDALAGANAADSLRLVDREPGPVIEP